MDIILIILASMSFILLLIMFIALLILTPHIYQISERTNILQLINERIKNSETYLRELSEEVNTSLSQPSNFPPIQGKLVFKTPDGKYTANSLDELINKILADPNSGFNENNIDELRKFFESQENQDDDEDEGDISGL